MSGGRIYIVRHGNTFDSSDTVLRVGRKTNLPLSISGVKQAEKLALAFRNTHFEAAYSSDLKRTRQTIEIILDGQPYQLADFLTEIDYGPDEGRPEAEVISRVGMKALKDWDENSIPPPGWLVDTQNLKTAWQAFFANCSAQSNTLVVTSNGVARFLLESVRGGENATRKLKTGAYGVVEISATGPRLVSWNNQP